MRNLSRAVPKTPLWSLKTIIIIFFTPFADTQSKYPSSGINMNSLDGIRAYAIILVVASHTNAMNMVGQGGLGVVLFFTLSGFLLTFPLISPSSRNRSFLNFGTLWKFYRNRLVRILPLYFITVYIYFGVIQENTDLLLKHLFLIKTVGHFWIIPQILIFYLVFPYILSIAKACIRINSISPIIFLLLLSYIIRTQLTSDVFFLDGNGKNLPWHGYLFFQGMAFAFLFRIIDSDIRGEVGKILRSLLKERIITIYVLLFIALSIGYTKATFAEYLSYENLKLTYYNVWQWLSTYGYLSGVLIISVLMLSENSRLLKFWQSWPMRHLGLLSYSLYLLHPFVIDELLKAGATKGTYLFVFTIICTYPICCLAYILIEKPILLLKT